MKMFPTIYRSFTGVLQELYRRFTGVLQEYRKIFCFLEVSTVLGKKIQNSRSFPGIPGVVSTCKMENDYYGKDDGE